MGSALGRQIDLSDRNDSIFSPPIMRANAGQQKCLFGALYAHHLLHTLWLLFR
jgi:hypothetical protein